MGQSTRLPHAVDGEAARPARQGDFVLLGTIPPSSMSTSCQRQLLRGRLEHGTAGTAIERTPGCDGARLQQHVRAGSPSVMPRRYATAGARTGNGLAAQLDALSSCVSIDMPTSRRLPCTSNENTAAVVRCKCIEDDVNHVYYAD